MEITGKIVKILDAQRFTSKKDGSEIVKNAFVIETQGQYPKTICFSVIGEEKFKQMSLVVGNVYNVSFDAESREWNSKFFTDLSAWKAVNLDGGQNGQTQQPAAAPSPQPAPANGVSPFPTADAQPAGGADDLPF
jgi:hypothetical protein